MTAPLIESFSSRKQLNRAAPLAQRFLFSSQGSVD
jgi:hypothetical protein